MFPLKDTIHSETAPLINSLFIIICTLVFLHEFTMQPAELDHYLDAWGVVPSMFDWGPRAISTVFSSMFLHAGWDHLIGNMWFLFLFGDNVEDRFGHVGYIFFYLFCGFVAALTQVFVNHGSHVAMVGASGAISGVLGAYFVFYPQAKIVTLFLLGIFTRLTEVPAVIFLGLWFAMQFFTGLGSLAITSPNEAGGVAFWAHVGGFVTGFAIAQFMPKPQYS
jgi:membrane associated rhomboid family serine protease